MTGIHKTLNKVIPKEDPGLRANPIVKKVNKENLRTHESLDRTFNPEIPTQEETPVIPLPDEEEIKRQKRRSASMRGGGRASTVFTESDRLGP